MSVLRTLAVVFFAVCSAGQSFGQDEIQAIEINEQLDPIENHISQSLYFKEHYPISSKEVAIQKEFKIYKPFNLHSDLSQESKLVHWFKFSLKNKTETNFKGYLYFGKFEKIKLFTENSNGKFDKLRTIGKLYKNQARLSQHHPLLSPFTLVKDEQQNFLIRITTPYIFCFDDEFALQIVPEDYSEFIVPKEKYEAIKYSIILGVLTVVSIIGLLCFICFFFTKEKSLLAFFLVCFTLVLNYAKELEFNTDYIIFWGYFDESIFSTIFLNKAFTVMAFFYFVFSYFDLGKYKNKLKITSLIASIAILLVGLWPFFVSEVNSHISVYSFGFFALDSLGTINSILLSLVVWRYNQLYSRGFVLAAMIYLCVGYLGNFIPAFYPEMQLSVLSYEMPSIFGLIFFVSFLGFIVFKRLITDYKFAYQSTLETEQLRKLNESRSKLYTNITHEFRTPLTVIAGMASDLNGNVRAKHLIQKNSEQLLHLINQLLNIAKAEQGDLSLQLIQGNIIHYINYLTESFHSLAEKKGIRLVSYADCEEITMDYDEELIKIIASNLITNALKFTPQNGKVIITMSVSKNHFIWKVKDSGIGIENEQLENIFDRFYQAEQSIDKKYQGSGIGLSLVKEIVTLLKGEIGVSSVVGAWTEFVLKLPIQNLAELSTYRRYSRVGITQDNLTPKVSMPKSNLPIILVVEDNEDVKEYIVNCIENEYSVFTAINGEEGSRMAIEITPDLIISDVMMPIKDGFTMTKELKLDERTNHIPVMLLTAKATHEEKLVGYEYGADAYLIKPFDKAELHIRITQLLENRKAIQLKYQNGITENKEQLPDWLIKLEDIVRNNLDEELQLDLLSKKMFMSRTQLHRKLKSLTGFSPGQYIKTIKLKEAKQLLLHSKKSIQEIGLDLAYKNASHFATDFKKMYGSSPTVMRNNVQSLV